MIEQPNAGSGAPDGFLGLVDTGFNGELMMTALTATALGFRLYDAHETVVLGDGRIESVQLGSGTIFWLGGQRRVDVMIPVKAVSPRTREPDEPVALIGTRLLTPHDLMIRFGRSHVAVSLETLP